MIIDVYACVIQSNKCTAQRSTILLAVSNYALEYRRFYLPPRRFRFALACVAESLVDSSQKLSRRLTFNDVYACFFFLEIFREFEAESGRLRRTASTRARLEEWPIPDTRVDLTLLYLINYSVRYPILQFVPSHIPSPRLSAPPFLDVARRRLRDLWNPFFFFFLPFSRSTNRPSIESRVCAICVNVNRDRSSIYSTKSKVYLKIDARRIVNERRERGRKWNEFGRFIKKKKDTND